MISKAPLLTKRQHEVAHLVATGLSNDQIAQRLFIERKTVERHMNDIYGMLGIVNTSQARILLARYVWIGAIPVDSETTRWPIKAAIAGSPEKGK